MWVVDDSALEAAAVCKVLAALYETVAFHDAAAMLESLAGQRPPDVLVLDWEMPGLSGPEVCRYLRSNPATDALAILLLTVHTRQDELVSGLEAGANDYLPKPFQRAELLARVGALARHRALVEGQRAQVEREREQWRQLAEALPQLVWVMRADGQPEYFNQRWSEFTGVPVGDIEREGWLRLFHPDDVPEVGRRRQHSLATGAPYEVEHRCRRRDGAWRWFLGRAQPVREGSGRIVRWLGTCTDIHAQKEAEAAMRASETRFRRLSEAGIVGVVEWDASGALTSVNDTFLGMLGYSREEADAGHLDFRALTPPEFQPSTEEAVRTLKATGIVRPFEKQYLRKDGSRLDVLISSATLDAARERGIALVLDISERKRAEAELRQRSEFEQQLIGIVSHDLRNPLQAILMSTGALFRHADELDEKTLRAAGRIQSAAERATRLVRDLLDFTRARLGGGIPVERQPANLHALVRQVAEDVQAGFPERTVQLEHAGPGDGEWDAHRLGQVAENLLANALKYSPPGTPVTVRTRGEDGWSWLEVHNRGPPIPPEQRPRLFQPFSRGVATQEAGHSVGLGLYIVDQLVRAHGGQVSVVSTDEEGTTFTVRLPRAATGP